MLYLIDNQIVISIIINIHYPELRLLLIVLCIVEKVKV
jgi:hypothetical protein